ncbi:MAG TPA: hypothetical protein HA254_01985 [Candidatus Diapherotrites archaeon]|uniref:Phosphoribosylformylglycinamidine synthase n=1 Tax=Candidatus Iainarchaeum sp. TaxID=3101447 RepID=A0A7J4J2F2_9ARCH|nr:hypothetical protein [Candidatus Diapherotrites archaeon]
MSMMHRVEVAFSDKSLDSAGLGAKSDIEEDLGIGKIEEAKFSEIYYIDAAGITQSELEDIASKVFTDPLCQRFSIDKDLIANFKVYIEIRLHPDVTDNVGIVALEGIEDFLGRKIEGNVRTARRYYFTGAVSKQDAERIARQLFANELIETFSIGEKSG